MHHPQNRNLQGSDLAVFRLYDRISYLHPHIQRNPMYTFLNTRMQTYNQCFHLSQSTYSYYFTALTIRNFPPVTKYHILHNLPQRSFKRTYYFSIIFRKFSTFSLISPLNTAVPATIIFAPASSTSCTLFSDTPPSTSISA